MFNKMAEMLSEFSEVGLPVWIALGTLVALAALLLSVGKARGRLNATALAYAALAVALSFLLSNIRLFRMPQGGSITPASMLPLMLFAHAFGVVPGLVAGLAYGVLQFLQTPGLLPIPPLYALAQIALDYLLAFGVPGLAGIGARKGEREALYLPLGIALASLLRFLCHVLSGALFFAEYAGDQNPLLYSAGYNSYMFLEMLICIVLGLLIGPRLAKIMRRSAGIR